jgi:hypothetical protein
VAAAAAAATVVVVVVVLKEKEEKRDEGGGGTKIYIDIRGEGGGALQIDLGVGRQIDPPSRLLRLHLIWGGAPRSRLIWRWRRLDLVGGQAGVRRGTRGAGPLCWAVRSGVL